MAKKPTKAEQAKLEASAYAKHLWDQGCKADACKVAVEAELTDDMRPAGMAEHIHGMRPNDRP